MRLDRLSSPIVFGATPVHVTPEGFRHYEGTATIGDVILPYLDPTPHLEFRPADEVLSPEAVESMIGKPITDNHPSTLLDPTTAKEHTEGAVLTASREDPGTNGATLPRLRVRIVVYTAPLQQKIEGGKIELSPGYNLKEDPTPGTFEGQPYHMVQRQVRYNHLAVVDRARTRTPTGEVARLDEEPMNQNTRNDGLSPEALKAIESWSEEDKAMIAEYIKCYEAEEAEQVAMATGASPEQAEAAEQAAMGAAAAATGQEGNMDEKMTAAMDALEKRIMDKINAAIPARSDAAANAGARLDVDAVTRTIEAKVTKAIATENAAYLRDFTTVRRDSADVLGDGVTHEAVVAAMLTEIKAHTPDAFPLAERALKAARSDASRLDDVRDFYRLAIKAKVSGRADEQEAALSGLAGGDNLVNFALPGKAI